MDSLNQIMKRSGFSETLKIKLKGEYKTKAEMYADHVKRKVFSIAGENKGVKKTINEIIDYTKGITEEQRRQLLNKKRK